MKVVDFHTCSPLHIPCGLTMGNFDGVHRGHVAILHHLRASVPKHYPLAVFTFTNHPSHILSGTSIPSIYTLDHKLKVLQEHGVDYVFLVTFTKEFAQIPYETFLRFLKEKTCFSHLVLGVGASFGKNRQGTADNVCKISEALHFTVEYIPKVSADDTLVSSQHIRNLIADGNLSEVHLCLGRPYSIYAPLSQHAMHPHELCLPPTGAYPIHVLVQEQRYPGTAHVNREARRVKVEVEALLPEGSFAEVVFL